MRVSAAARGSGADNNLPVVVGDGGGPKECTERGPRLLSAGRGTAWVDRGGARAAVARARLPYRSVTPHPSLADTLKDLGDQAKYRLSSLSAVVCVAWVHKH